MIGAFVGFVVPLLKNQTKTACASTVVVGGILSFHWSRLVCLLFSTIVAINDGLLLEHRAKGPAV